MWFYLLCATLQVNRSKLIWIRRPDPVVNLPITKLPLVLVQISPNAIACSVASFCCLLYWVVTRNGRTYWHILYVMSVYANVSWTRILWRLKSVGLLSTVPFYEKLGWSSHELHLFRLQSDGVATYWAFIKTRFHVSSYLHIIRLEVFVIKALFWFIKSKIFVEIFLVKEKKLWAKNKLWSFLGLRIFIGVYY